MCHDKVESHLCKSAEDIYGRSNNIGAFEALKQRQLETLYETGLKIDFYGLREGISEEDAPKPEEKLGEEKEKHLRASVREYWEENIGSCVVGSFVKFPRTRMDCLDLKMLLATHLNQKRNLSLIL